MKNEPSVPRHLNTRILDAAVIISVLAGGWWFWAYFFGFGRVVFSFDDWPMHAYALDIYRLSLAHGEVPWIVNWAPIGVPNFLADPETPLSPLLLLLPWISDSTFVILETCLIYGIGVWGWWILKRELNWSRLTFVLAVVVVSFNGYIVAHFAEGHFMWRGYFLSPWVLLSLHRMLVSQDRVFSWLPLSFALFALFFLGAFHIAFWWFIFIGLVAVQSPKSIPGAVAAVCGAGLMAMFRILPAMFFVPKKPGFLTGYRSPGEMLEAFTQIRGFAPMTPPWPVTVASLGWWEFDHYVGWPVLLLVVLLAVAGLLFWRKDIPCAWPLAGASLGIAVLSYGGVYGHIYSLPLSVFKSERVTSRFVCLSFLGLILIAFTGLERCKSRSLRIALKCCSILVLLFAIHDFAAHDRLWLLPKLEASNPFSPYFPGSVHLVPAILPAPRWLRYKLIVTGSAFISLIACFSLGALWMSDKVRLLVTGKRINY